MAAMLRRSPCVLALLVALPINAAVAADALVVEAAPAEEAVSPFDISFTVNGVTDYRFRGISQTGRDPAIQGTMEATYSLLYAGAFISNVDFGTPDPDLEVDVFAGIRPEWMGLTFDLGVVGYLFPDADELDFYEVRGSVGYDFEVAALTGTIFYAPEFGGTDFEGTYVEGAASIPLPYDFALSGAVGHQFFESGFATDDYTTWNVGLSYALTENVTFDLRYHDTDLAEDLFCTGTFHCGSTVVGTVSVNTALSELANRFTR